MDEYIERAKAKEELMSWAVCIKHPEHLSKDDAMFVLDLIPAADVVEVKHGFWKPYQTPLDSRQTGWICTNCSGVQRDVSSGNTNYCPNCGAVMEDWEDENAAD